MGRTLLLTSLDVANNIPLQDVAMARNRWIPEHLHRPARHEDREHHANVDEDVQNNEDNQTPFPVLARRYAHEHDGYGDLASCFGRGRELEGNPCELHGIHDPVWFQRGGMPPQAIAVVRGASQKTQIATQEDLMAFVNHIRWYTNTHAAESHRQLTKDKSDVQSSAPTFRTILALAQNLKARTITETTRPETITPMSAGARFSCPQTASMAGVIAAASCQERNSRPNRANWVGSLKALVSTHHALLGLAMGFKCMDNKICTGSMS